MNGNKQRIHDLQLRPFGIQKNPEYRINWYQLILIIHPLAILLVTLFGMVKTWPFWGVKWPANKGWKGIFESPGPIHVRMVHLPIHGWFFSMVKKVKHRHGWYDKSSCQKTNWNILQYSKFLTQSFEVSHSISHPVCFPGSAGGGEKGRWNVLLERNYNL